MSFSVLAAFICMRASDPSIHQSPYSLHSSACSLPSSPRALPKTDFPSFFWPTSPLQSHPSPLLPALATLPLNFVILHFSYHPVEISLFLHTVTCLSISACLRRRYHPCQSSDIPLFVLHESLVPHNSSPVICSVTCLRPRLLTNGFGFPFLSR